jgi:hypothetical protein
MVAPLLTALRGHGQKGAHMGTIVRSPDQPDAQQFENSELRYSVMVKGKLFNNDYPEGLLLRIVNISEGGIMAVIPYGVRVFSNVVVELRNLPLTSGRIAWARKDRIGVAFDERIDLDLFFGRSSEKPAQEIHRFDPDGRLLKSEPLIRRLNS